MVCGPQPYKPYARSISNKIRIARPLVRGLLGKSPSAQLLGEYHGM